MGTESASLGPAAGRTARSRIASGPLALAALGLLIAVSALAHIWLGRRVPSPWYVDEFVYGTSARSIAANWHLLYERFAGEFYLYPRLIAPAWLADSPGHAYAIAKAINAALISLAAMPAYLWSRRLVGPLWALVPAALVLVLPTTLYSAMLVTENAFFPAFLLALYAIAASLERPRPRTQLLALAAIGLACAIRLQGLVLVLVLLSGIVVKTVLDARHEPGGSWRRRARGALHDYAVIGGALAASGIAYGLWQVVSGGVLTGGLGVYSGAVTLDYSVPDVIRWLVYHAAGLVLSCGLLPFSALVLLIADVYRRGAVSSAAERAFVAVGASAIFWLVLQVGIFASRRGERIDERYFFHVVPVFLIGLALWLARGAYRSPRAVFVAALVPAALLIALPLVRLLADPGHASDTFTLVALERLRSHLAAPDDLELLIALAAAAVATAIAFVPRQLLAVIAPAVLLLWFLYASTAVAHSLRDSSLGVLDGTRLGAEPGGSITRSGGERTSRSLIRPPVTPRKESRSRFSRPTSGTAA